MSPRVTPELWPALCPLLLGVFPHSAALGDYEDQFYSLFAFRPPHADYALDARDARNALTIATPKGRAQVAWYWWRQADSATDYGATLYRERLKFLLTNVWPIERELREGAASANLAKLATCCSSAFPDAVDTILPLLAKLREPHDVVLTLKEDSQASLVEKYPGAVLALLDAVTGDQIAYWAWQDFRALLSQISAANPALAEDARFVRLDAIVRAFE